MIRAYLKARNQPRKLKGWQGTVIWYHVMAMTPLFFFFLEGSRVRSERRKFHCTHSIPEQGHTHEFDANGKFRVHVGSNTCLSTRNPVSKIRRFSYCLSTAFGFKRRLVTKVTQGKRWWAHCVGTCRRRRCCTIVMKKPVGTWLVSGSVVHLWLFFSCFFSHGVPVV